MCAVVVEAGTWIGRWSVIAAAGMMVSSPGLAAAQEEPESAPEYGSLVRWTEDTHSEALSALAHSCAYFRRLGSGRTLEYGDRRGTTEQWLALCEAADGLPADDTAVREFMERWLEPVPVEPLPPDEGLFTGYYVVDLQGGRQRSERNHVPVYRTPPRPEGGRYPSRAEIAQGALADRELELLWVDDAAGLFFAEIEGSGVVSLDDGTEVRIEYDGQNGHPYFPIGRALIDDGEATLDQISMQFIRGWMADHPDHAQALMDRNPSYVFFKLGGEGDGAQGAIAETLTPLRSMAVDRRHVPLGIPLWIELEGDCLPEGHMERLVFAQDVGGAVQGRVRGDLFWGRGEDATRYAGTMRATGRYHMLVPRAQPLPAAPAAGEEAESD